MDQQARNTAVFALILGAVACLGAAYTAHRVGKVGAAFLEESKLASARAGDLHRVLTVAGEPKRIAWEYTIVAPNDVEIESEMKRLGEEGWELVTARRATNVVGAPMYEMILKRPKTSR